MYSNAFARDSCYRVLCMKMKLITKLLVAASVVGVMVCYPCAEPLQQKKENSRKALLDEADAPASATNVSQTPEPATPQQAQAPAPQPQQAQQQASPACEPATPEKEESKVPVLPIVLASIGTIAFIVLAIIF